MAKKAKDEAVPSGRSRGDLTWFFCSAESELGIRSSMGAMLNKLELGLGDDGSTIQIDTMAFSRLVAAERYGRILDTLRLCGTENASILEAVYTARQFPVAIREYFQESAPIAIRLPMVRRLYKQAATDVPLIDWLCRLVVMGTKEEKDLIKTLRIKSENTITNAYKAYERAAKLAPRDDED